MSKDALFQRLWNNIVWNTEERKSLNEIEEESWTSFSKSASGISITEKTALTFSAVWACTRILTGVISSLPLKIYQKTDNGRREATEHPLWPILTRQPSQRYTKVTYLNRGVNHYLNWGNHLAQIHRNQNERPVSFELIHPSLLGDIGVSTRGNLVYEIKDPETKKIKKVLGKNILHVPNLGDDEKGKGIIANAKDDIGLAISAMKFGSKFFADEGKPTGLFSSETVKPEQIPDIKKAYKEQKKAGGDIVLTGGFKYSPISIPPDDAQFLGTQQFGVETISRWYGVPVSKLSQLVKTSYNSFEALGIEFLQDTIAPILAKWENEYTVKLLDGENDYYIEFNIDAYLRADSAAKSEKYRTYIQNGLRTINEVRALDNLNSVEGGDKLYVQQNMTTIENISEGNNLKQESNGVEE